MDLSLWSAGRSQSVDIYVVTRKMLGLEGYT